MMRTWSQDIGIMRTVASDILSRLNRPRISPSELEEIEQMAASLKRDARRLANQPEREVEGGDDD